MPGSVVLFLLAALPIVGWWLYDEITYDRQKLVVEDDLMAIARAVGVEWPERSG